METAGSSQLEFAACHLLANFASACLGRRIWQPIEPLVPNIQACQCLACAGDSPFTINMEWLTRSVYIEWFLDKGPPVVPCEL